MCLILFAYHKHPKYPLIVAANRDEFYDRKTKEAHFWEDIPEVLAGRDLEKMGTWMGVTKHGRFAALTNYRNPLESMEGKRSRGELVTRGLTFSGNIKNYLEKISAERNAYPGYNLLIGDLNSLYYYSNIEGKRKELSPGVYGLSNHLLNTNWPKVKKGKEELEKIINSHQDIPIESLFTLLANDEIAADHLLPNTGVPLEMERMLSPLFIRSHDYGTRSSTVLLYSKKDIYFIERVYSGHNFTEQHYKIQLTDNE